MKDDLFGTFRKRIIYGALVSVLITGAAELIVFFNLRLISDFLRKSGYRNSILGRDGLNPNVQMMILLVAGGIVFIVSFNLLMDGVIRYVKEISNGINRIAQGDLNTEISVRGNDEFANIARNLNKMTEEVRVLMDKEREAERSKNDLITNVAHDLRTPLTSIIGYLELLKNKKDLDEEVKRKFIDIAYSKSKRLEKLIDLTRRIQIMGGRTLDFSAFDSKKIDEYSALAREKWGDTEAYREFEEKHAARSRGEELRTGADMMQIFADFGALPDRDPASDAAQALVQRLRDFITANYYDCTPQILAGLGAMYAAEGEMRDNIDRAGGSGTAVLAAEAVRIYCEQN